MNVIRFKINKNNFYEFYLEYYSLKISIFKK